MKEVFGASTVASACAVGITGDSLHTQLSASSEAARLPSVKTLYLTHFSQDLHKLWGNNVELNCPQDVNNLVFV